MFRSKSNLAKGLLLLLVASWCAGCGADKPPESELDPAHIGVNFWSSAMAEEEGEDQMFAPDQNAYVLLQAGEDNHHIGDVVGAGLRPIFRFDAWGKAVPQCIYGGAICTIDDNRESCDDCNHWSMAFARFIAQVNGVDPDDAGASDDPVGLIQELENVVFVVGNEPWLDGGIRLRDYAAAYSVIWRAVHLDKDDPQYTQENPRFPSIRLAGRRAELPCPGQSLWRGRYCQHGNVARAGFPADLGQWH